VVYRDTLFIYLLTFSFLLFLYSESPQVGLHPSIVLFNSVIIVKFIHTFCLCAETSSRFLHSLQSKKTLCRDHVRLSIHSFI
jgi:hypothetical protein